MENDKWFDKVELTCMGVIQVHGRDSGKNCVNWFDQELGVSKEK